jgi:hypothetical protein
VQHLGGYVAGGADGHADGGQRERGLVAHRDAEVDDHRAVRGQQDVVRLHVAVHESGAVDRGQRLRHARRPARTRSTRAAVLSRPPPRPARARARTRSRDKDARRRCRRPRRSPCRARRPPSPPAPRARSAPGSPAGPPGRADDLHRHRTSGRRDGQIDAAHAAVADDRLEPIRPEALRIVPTQSKHVRQRSTGWRQYAQVQVVRSVIRRAHPVPSADSLLYAADPQRSAIVNVDACAALNALDQPARHSPRLLEQQPQLRLTHRGIDQTCAQHRPSLEHGVSDKGLAAGLNT